MGTLVAAILCYLSCVVALSSGSSITIGGSGEAGHCTVWFCYLYFFCVSVISSVGVAASFGRTWFPPCEDFGLVDWQLSSAKTKVSRLSWWHRARLLLYNRFCWSLGSHFCVCILVELRLRVLRACFVNSTMPLKKKGAQAPELEELEESDLNPESPLSHASTLSGQVSVFSAEVLQSILSNNQASLLEGQRVLQQERAELQHKMEHENRTAMKALIEALPAALPAAPRKSRVEVPKWSESEVPHEYLAKYEFAQVHNGVDKNEWGLLLQVYLSGTAQSAYAQLDPGLYRDYDLVKEQLLKALRDTPEQADRRWWALAKRQNESFGAFLVRMRSTATV